MNKGVKITLWVFGILFVLGGIGTIFEDDVNSGITGNAINIQENAEANMKDLSEMSVSKKKKLCTELCAGEDIIIPVIKNECSYACSQIYYYTGEEGLDEHIEDFRE